MKVLLAYDGSSCADAAISDLRIAGLPNDTTVLVVTVAHEGWPPSEHSGSVLGQFGSPWKELMKDTSDIAARAAEQIQLNFPQWTIASEPLWGAPAETLRRAIEHWHADTVFVGARVLGSVDRLFLESVSSAVVTHVHCAVEVVR